MAKKSATTGSRKPRSKKASTSAGGPSLYPPPTPPSAPAPTPSKPASKPGVAEKLRGLKGKMPTAKGALALGAGGAVGALVLANMLRRKSPAMAAAEMELERSVQEAERRAKSEKLAAILEQSRNEQSILENQNRLARTLPDVYTSVLAGRRIPAGSIVLGGRPRTDLLRDLAASMGSGRFENKNPLSELIG